MTTQPLTTKILNATVLVTALGYLVDVYDLLLVNAVRVASLTDLGVVGDAQTNAGLLIINAKQVGLLLGGLLWGVLGDKIGRKQCLLGSILVYSLATLGCAFIQSVNQFAALQFIGGIGLAGEVGLGVALITETVDKHYRGLATTLFAFIGISGAVLAAVAAELLPWRTCYLIGGVAGLALLVLRSLVMESGLFERARNTAAVRGSLKMLFGQWPLLRRYLACVLTAMPIYFTIGIVWTFAPELSAAMGIAEPARATLALAFGYGGMMLGDAAAGLISQWLQRRRRVVKIFVCCNALVIAVFLTWRGIDAPTYYAFCAILGFLSGYFITITTMVAEQFGTNIRATATASAPNMMRATVIPMNLLFLALKPLGTLPAVGGVAAAAIIIALLALTQLKETFSKDLDYTE